MTSSAIDLITADAEPSMLLDRRRSAAYLAIPAAWADPGALAMMVRYGSGLLYVALPDKLADRLALPVMVPGGRRILGCRAAVTIDAADGVTTGISAADRARTVRLLADPSASIDDFTRPGHIVPLRVGRASRFGRASAVHAALALATRHALPRVAVLTELVSETDPRHMADIDEAREIAQRIGLLVVSA